MKELELQNAERLKKLQEYDKNKKWNIDNMFEVKEERTMVNPTPGPTFTETGFVKPKEDDRIVKPPELAVKATGTAKGPSEGSKPAATKPTKASASTAAAKTTAKPAPDRKPAPVAAAAAAAKPDPSSAMGPSTRPVDLGVMDTYVEFTEKYADTVELFMALPDLASSKEFLLKYADIVLQENASNYLLLASLEDEMNGYRDKMKRTARQSQIISNIAELAKTLNTHPGNVIEPFFARMQQREHFEEFQRGVDAFVDKIIKRAVVKKKEIDAQRAAEEGPTDLQDIPKEERLGPGGLDPLEVIETLPEEMVKAFESRDVEQLKEALIKLDPNDAEYHMKRCIDSGLWVANA